MTAYRDTSGKALADYPRPSVAVDTAVLTVSDGVLSVVVTADASAGFRLPGTFLHTGERLADAVARSLADKAGVSGLTPVQLHVFDALDRDERGWVLSVAHMVAVPADALASTAALVQVGDVAPMAFDHSDIVALAVERLRADYSRSPDPWRLLGRETFTLLELERLHRAVDPAGTPMRDSFRRSMVGMLADTGEVERGTVGKPARLFRRIN
ncbi:NUDIX hydrolase [Demequina sediminicola]|uniref:NUDIX hydrolase n=1 Tax=Demequina sediminicola TaxID=1095026 RepID=UPI0007836E20|nr:NUDIX hydrolase [Demequina sediminicola]